MHRRLIIFLATVLLLQSTVAAPLPAKTTHNLPIVKTTVNSKGQVIDWVKAESQGEIATPPSSPPRSRIKARALLAEDPAAHKGPEGTVPIFRSKATKQQAIKKLPGLEDNSTLTDGIRAKAGYAGSHWYASSGQVVPNLGGSAVYSLFNPYVQYSSDFSLVQTAVIRDNVPVAGGGSVIQTVEAGWINYPDQIVPPHLFVFFTTNGYQGMKDNIGGWNRDVDGWVQYDDEIYPGITFSPLSQDNGGQYGMEIRFYLFEGNWWLWVLDRWIGYYPGRLFTRDVSPFRTLQTGSNRINFYGEIFNSGTALTTTDMGSGEFPELGFGRSAYMHNITYTDLEAHDQHFDGSQQLVTSDAARYRQETHFKPNSNWGSYVLFGGPGAEGKVGG